MSPAGLRSAAATNRDLAGGPTNPDTEPATGNPQGYRGLRAVRSRARATTGSRRSLGRQIQLGGEVEKLSNCRQCGARLGDCSTGRPREYCSLACRRALEIRRSAWDDQLTRLERDVIDYATPFWTAEQRALARQRRDAFLAECPRP
jgi:hypothetical protein